MIRRVSRDMIRKYLDEITPSGFLSWTWTSNCNCAVQRCRILTLIWKVRLG